ncbi:glycoside hydrolase family 27 protein [Microbacterium sp. EYE_5]|uniref:glycoside hydrolase family 27 protein n=1 Tax=unclassified Microbacterium TaxID=2609290 RepID=UPI002003C836|nr:MULTISPECIES: glycoside hydrolase family 27 protein [unclassified Microbacterium]MCK6079396.1 glycoside hydrolase family 27 protein [Microbacterium sp. EYE_382]MCK6084666.1 glycoside hydrolase family 27 protein [Microbacterium sp. EYE_384]MCK6123105.1 glycoside hydrolase family 27 protein [Microbacterium sp. EYE_80]MCK6125430.1 glycoside hydrolase family 27 protein [Microbacterium sp. EYE_79]MCK6140350.1 glycoside hydrolase family 27 protein [Microbacterium sp. EYE_39]
MIAGDWIVRGIYPVISSVHIGEDGAGHLEMWGDEVAVTAESAEGRYVLQTSADAPFPLTIDSTVEGDLLHLQFRNVGVFFDLTADRADLEQLAAYRASRPIAIPAPALADVPANGLATSPPMGWNSWFGLRLNVTDASVREIADALVSTGLRDAGYTFVNIDDGWQGGRDLDGTLLPNRGFPDMPALGRHLHGLELRFGIYSSPGPATCADYTGSFGHEERDALTFASWGVDYLKYDWCSAHAFYRTEAGMRGAFQRMGAALQASGRPIIFSLCQYGTFDVPRWGGSVGGNLWRVSSDVEDSWESIEAIGFAEPRDPDTGWNDLDMLQIGLGNLTIVEYRTQMTMWAMRSAPLIISCDPRDLTEAEVQVLTNRNVIAIDQDPLAATPTRHRVNGLDVWVKPLLSGAAVSVINRTSDVVSARINWDDLGLVTPLRVVDLWTGEYSDPGTGWNGGLQPRECSLVRLTF